MQNKITQNQIDDLYNRLKKEAESSGYHLNPDINFAKDLIESLLINEARYGYWACPCRLASGNKSEDIDIICPCDYRDADLSEFDACFCALYVSGKVVNGEKEAVSIPERRLSLVQRKANKQGYTADISSLSFPVWRCKVCGYLCAREEAPENCPICKAKKERFERFM